LGTASPRAIGVKVSLCQYQKLNRLRENSGKSLSEIVREAASPFVRKTDFPASAFASYLPKGTRDKYKSVSAYFARPDWNLLANISKQTGRCKTHLMREAVDEYLGGTAVQGKRKGKASSDDG